METSGLTNPAIPKTLLEAVAYFADPQVCHDFFTRMRWASGVCCPRCGDTAVGFVKTRRIWNCKGCKKQFSVKVGTIFEDSPLGLDKWLPAVWLITNCKNGVSSCEVARALGITQKSAWFMLHRIRLAMEDGTFEKFSGTVEADETYIGGKEKNKHYDKKLKAGRGSVGKTVVMGLLERGTPYIDKNGEEKKTTSKVKACIIDDTKQETLHGVVKAAVVPGSELMTDSARGYRGLTEFYRHQWIDHAVRYVEGRIYTNGLENFWSLVDRMIGGTYVSVEPEHLMAYLDEQTFRFNERGTDDAGRFVKVVKGTMGKRLTYRALIGNPQGIDSPDPLRGGPRAD